MADVNLEFPKSVQSPATHPTIKRDSHYLKGGGNFTSDKFKLTVPTGKFCRVVVKAIIQSITEEEYNKYTKKKK